MCLPMRSRRIVTREDEKMGKKSRRGRLARGIEHFLSIEMQGEQSRDVEWLRGQVKAAVRMAKDVDAVIRLYEEDFRSDIVSAVKEAISANDQSAGA